MPKLKALEQPPPLAKMAYHSLRDSILTGDLKPGEIYNEMALAKELGISRTPVREALLELSTHGLVTFLPRKGVIVNDPSPRDVEELFEVRRAIELAAIEKVSRSAPPCDLGPLEKSLQDQRRALSKGDFLSYMEADRLFHATLSHLANNRRMVAILENIRDLIHLIGYHALATEGRGEAVIVEHQKVLEALRSGQPSAARKALEYHLDQSRAAVDKAYAEKGRTASPREGTGSERVSRSEA